MKVIVSIDSFKGSISSLDAAEAVKVGILRVYENAEVICLPLADGGEGTVESLCKSKIKVFVTGPIGEQVCAEYGITDDGKTAVIEMAAAAGLPLVPENKRNPLITTTYGVGEIIKDALSKGCKSFIVGIGGSATNDGGVGMLSALGFGFLDKNRKPIRQGAIGLMDLEYIDVSNVLPELKDCEFRIACDVSNPLCGENGCSAVYGPQKGADKEAIEQMDGWLNAYADKAKNVFPNSDKNYPGTGAAGGMGFAFMTFLGGILRPGVDIVTDHICIDEKVRDADIVITGEGRLDGQTVMGKAPIGVARIAKKYGKTVIAFSGTVTDDAVKVNTHGIDAFFPICRKPMTLAEAMNKDNAVKNMSDTSEQVFRLIKASKDMT